MEQDIIAQRSGGKMSKDKVHKISENDPRFVLKQSVSFESIVNGAKLPTSDLLLTMDGFVYQFEYQEPERVVKKIQVVPGIYTLNKVMGGIDPVPTKFIIPPLLSSVMNTEVIKGELRAFKDGLEIYRELDQPAKRAILLYSDPGLGKTVSMQLACIDEIAVDPGTAVFVWPTGSVDADDIYSFMMHHVEYVSVTNLIFIIEDIGGTSHEGHGGPRSVDTDLLNLLDGIGNPFPIPTFIMATTNYPQNFLSAIADRPGRFDEMIKLLPPTGKQQLDLVEFIAKRALTDEEKEAFNNRDAKHFSIAYLKEIVIRSRLHNKTVAEVIKEIIEHRKLFSGGFDERGEVGIGIGNG